MTSELRGKIITRYRSGESSLEVAEGLGMAKTTVLRILKEAGVKIRPHGVRYR